MRVLSKTIVNVHEEVLVNRAKMSPRMLSTCSKLIKHRGKNSLCVQWWWLFLLIVRRTARNFKKKMAENKKRTLSIELGYLEECAAWKLESRFFPSKVGGKPAWLDLCHLPNSILCGNCKKPCICLCQVYAPFEEFDSCFHRTIFVFFCKDPACCRYNDNKNFIVYRCQLNRINVFYSFEPPIEEENSQPGTKHELCKTCCVCGAKSGSHCGKCKVAYYCSKEHQIIDWKSGHKEKCSAGTEHEDKESEERRDVLVPQFEIVIEAEDCLQEEEVSNDLKTEEEKLKAFEKMVQEGKAGTLQGDTSFDELQKTTSPEDRQFSKFNSRIRRNPDQVLRYDRGGTPLWISSDHTPNEDDIPCCEYCGQHRRFEFQILPQLLNYLGLDSTEKSVDWGTLAIYTCSQSCNEGPAYKREFLWKQDIV